ncbi:hypothetical protein Tco_0461896 [Tanacetum coccineum]
MISMTLRLVFPPWRGVTDCMSPPIRRKYHDSVAFATGCKKIKKCRRGNRKIRIPIAMWPCRVEEKMTLKEVDGQTIEEIETKIIAKDGTITRVPGKFQGYETSEEEPVEQPRRHDLYGFVDHPQLQQGNLMNEFAPHRLPQPKGNMNGWLIENEEEVERDEVDSDLESTASSKPVWEKTTEDDHDRASQEKHGVHLKLVLELLRKEKLYAKVYYLRLIAIFFRLLNTLTPLTERNQKYEWGAEREEAFQILKIDLCDASINQMTRYWPTPVRSQVEERAKKKCCVTGPQMKGGQMLVPLVGSEMDEAHASRQKVKSTQEIKFIRIIIKRIPEGIPGRMSQRAAMKQSKGILLSWVVFAVCVQYFPSNPSLPLALQHSQPSMGSSGCVIAKLAKLIRLGSGSGLTADSSVLTLTLAFLDFGLDFA